MSTAAQVVGSEGVHMVIQQLDQMEVDNMDSNGGVQDANRGTREMINPSRVVS